MGLIIVVVVVGAIAAAVTLRRRSQDDEHSVEGYHKQLHTLEVVRAHTSPEVSEGVPAVAGISYPEVAFRVSTHATVRLTEPGKPAVPPVPPPPVADPDRPVTFDDAGPVITTPTTTPASDWHEDRALHGINHRPRRLAAPGAAVVAVMLVIVVLLVTGNHTVPPRHASNPPARTHHRVVAPTHHATTVTTRTRHHNAATTKVAPIVSLPTGGSAHSAVYAVRPNSYTLTMSATTSQCWVNATEAGSGAVLFTGVLNPGQTQSVTATGAVSLIVGAPDAFAGNIDGTSLSFPFGFQAPFTMQMLPAGQSQG